MQAKSGLVKTCQYLSDIDEDLPVYIALLQRLFLRFYL